MNEVYERNNIYFMYLKERFEDIYLVIETRAIMCEYKSKCVIGTKEDLYNNDDIIIAPIDLLLYHVESLEYLNRDYTNFERKMRKDNTMPINKYKKLKYIYSSDDINEMYNEIKQTDVVSILDIVSRYRHYFERRKKDSVLRIYTSY